jgi:hypothetical protein
MTKDGEKEALSLARPSSGRDDNAPSLGEDAAERISLMLVRRVVHQRRSITVRVGRGQQNVERCGWQSEVL